MAISNTGICLICKQTIEHLAVTKHLSKCLEKNASDTPSEKEKIFVIKVFAGRSFWLYVEMNGSASLGELDSFLRGIWLECCGHMSQFIINGNRYSSTGGMEKVIHRLFAVGDKFDYEYDFGSTTNLSGKVISTRPGELKEGLRLLARNHLPADILCINCQKTPDTICSVCQDFFCEKCCKNYHNNCEGEEFMLPVVNSPRMGVCGYAGPDA
jgi:hypothetical protein